MFLELTCDFGVVVNILHRDVQWDIFCIELEFKLIVFELEVQDVWHHAIGYGIHAAGVFLEATVSPLADLAASTVPIHGSSSLSEPQSQSTVMTSSVTLAVKVDLCSPHLFFIPTCQ